MEFSGHATPAHKVNTELHGRNTGPQSAVSTVVLLCSPVAMNPRLLLTASAVALGATGIVASFLPVELLDNLHPPGDRVGTVIVQMLGAALIGFAMLNWMARGAPAGGIYGRPIVSANLVHFMVAGIALMKVAAVGGVPTAVTILAIVYSLFAIGFALVMFGPGPRNS